MRKIYISLLRKRKGGERKQPASEIQQAYASVRDPDAMNQGLRGKEKGKRKVLVGGKRTTSVGRG